MVVDWEQIVAEYGPRVWRTVYSILGHYADAADCYQETFLCALEVTRRQEVKDWLRLLQVIATKRAIDRLRQNIGLRNRFDRDDIEARAGSENCPVREAEFNELLQRLKKELARIPQKQAEVFWLNSVEDLSYRQIAEEMGITENEVGVLLFRARANLQEVLHEPYANKGAKK